MFPELKPEISNDYIELQALITERDGMVAQNIYFEHDGKPPAYGEMDFARIAEKMRSLKTITTPSPEAGTHSKVAVGAGSQSPDQTKQTDDGVVCLQCGGNLVNNCTQCEQRGI